MKKSVFHRALKILEDFCGSLGGDGPPLGKILDREYVAAWHQFRFFKPGEVQVLVDVGAHNGWYAKRAALYFPLQRSILIEPLPANAARLRKLGLPGLKVVEAAMSDKIGRAKFTIIHTAQASSLLEMSPGMTEAYQLDMSGQQEIEVSVGTLDALCEEENIEHIDLLKIDVQGAEKLLLAGAKHALRRTKYLQIEMLFVEHYRECALFHELDELCRAAGFELCRLVGGTNDPNGRLLQADGVYKNTRALQGVGF
jgi:FkbM family methyltransferase